MEPCCPAVVYVYLGNPLPQYAWHSLTLARKNISNEIIVITDQDGQRVPKGVTLEKVGTWYEKGPFLKFAKRTNLDNLFRGGFWLHAVERFYVLEQYMAYSGRERIFHSELDVLLFDLDHFDSHLDQLGNGVFLPLESANRAIASLAYIRGREGLALLLSFFEENAHLGNEMMMLGSFVQRGGRVAHSIASDRIFDRDGWPYSSSVSDENQGLVDCSAFGQWLLGQDPRNVAGTSWNHHVGAISYEISSIKFRSNLMGDRLFARAPKSSWLPVRALHVHSKTFRRLRLPGSLILYSAMARLPWKTPIVHSLGGVFDSILKVMLSRRLAPVLGRLKVGDFHLVRGLIQFLVGRSSTVLSNREREGLLAFFTVGRPKKKDLVQRVVTSNESNANFPQSWEALLANCDPRLAHSARIQIGIFVASLEGDQPAIYLGSDLSKNEVDAIQNHLEINCLALAPTKDYEATRHALAFWRFSPGNNKWSFSTQAQVIDPHFVRQMFPGGIRDVFRWADLGLSQPRPSLSAFQSYGTWLVNSCPRQINFIAQPSNRIGGANRPDTPTTGLK